MKSLMEKTETCQKTDVFPSVIRTWRTAMPNITVPVHCAHWTGRFIRIGFPLRPETGWMIQKKTEKGLDFPDCL